MLLTQPNAGGESRGAEFLKNKKEEREYGETVFNTDEL